MNNFIISADWHLREKAPRCRRDEDWLLFQQFIVKEIISICNKKHCDLILVGDIFDTPNVPAYVLNTFISECSKIKNVVYFLAGNHDLPFHSIENIDRSAIGILKNLSLEHNRIKYGIDFYGQWTDFNDEIKGKNTELLFIHRLVFKSAKDLPPNVNACTAQDLLDEFPKAKWIFTGDMHKKFHYENKGRHVINPGCINRQASDFKEYKPSIYYVDTDDNIVEEILLNDSGQVVDDTYIKSETERENRIEAFVEGVKKNGKVSLDFMQNLEEAINKNKKLSKETKDMIYELCEEEK